MLTTCKIEGIHYLLFIFMVKVAIYRIPLLIPQNITFSFEIGMFLGIGIPWKMLFQKCHKTK